MKKIVLKSLMVAILLSVFTFRPAPARAQDVDLNEIVEILQEMLPISMGTLGEMTDIYLEYNELVLVSNVDESIVNIANLQKEPALLKENLRQMVLDEDSSFRFLVDELLKSGKGLRLVYIGKTTGKSVSCAMTSKELKQAINSGTDDPMKRLEMQIKITNAQLPMDLGNGLVNTKLVKEGNYVVYYYDCDEDMIDIEILQNTTLMKGMLLEEINSDDPAISLFRQYCKDAGCGIAYCYVGKTSGKVARILLPVNELK